MGEKGVQAVGKPDVSIESKARNGINDNWYLDITHTAQCNHGCGSFSTPDVRTAIRWADEHEESDHHLLSKWDRLSEEEQAQPRNFDLRNRVELIFAKMADAKGQRSQIYVRPTEKGREVLAKYEEGLEQSADWGSTRIRPHGEPIGGMEKHEH